MEKYKVETSSLKHVPGAANKEPDYLSRPSLWETTPTPEALKTVKVVKPRTRDGSFYPLPTPGRQPDLWASSNLEEDCSPWQGWKG